MEINVRRIAELALLDISESDIPRFERDMEEIADMVARLPQLDDNGLMMKPMELRDDVTEENAPSHAELMQNAPETVKGCFAVPRTVDY